MYFFKTLENVQFTVRKVMTNQKAILFSLQPAILSGKNTSSRRMELKLNVVLAKHVAG
jgi:hypothetical protein